MSLAVLMTAAGVSAICVGAVLLIWSLARGKVSELGMTFVLVGLLLELLAWFIG